MEAISNKISRKDIEREARRKAILDTAIELFSVYGFYEVTVDQIAEKVGLSKGTIYLYFENKDALFYSIITEKTKELMEKLNNSINQPEPFMECIHNFVHSYLKFFKQNDAFFKIMHSAKSRMNAETHYKFHDHGKEVYKEFLELVCQIIKQGQQEKVLRASQSEAMCKVLQGTLNAYTFHRVFDTGVGSVEEETREIMDLFVEGAKIND